MTQPTAATKVVSESAAGVVVQSLRSGDELWFYERHEDNYIEIDEIDSRKFGPVQTADQLLENSSDFNYALLQSVRQKGNDLEYEADELVIYRGNVVKVTRSDRALALLVGYLVEVAPEDYHLTADPAEATHGFIDVGVGDWQIVPIAELNGSVKLRRIGQDTYRGY